MQQQFLRSHATQLTPQDRARIRAFQAVKGGAAAASKEYKIGTTRVYKIWRGVEADDAITRRPIEELTGGGGPARAAVPKPSRRRKEKEVESSDSADREELRRMKRLNDDLKRRH